jgi:hypothetical protein
MTELMASDAAPLPKAGALARLGNLYLKAVRAPELQRENRALRQRVAALEKANTALEQRIAALERPGGALTRRGDPELPLSEVLTRSFEARLLERAERAVAAGLAPPLETKKEQQASPRRHGAGERRLDARDERQPLGPGPGEKPRLTEPDATGTGTAPKAGSGRGARYG